MMPIGIVDQPEGFPYYRFFAVIVITIVLDFVWAKYTIAVNERKPWLASALSAILFLCSGAVVLQYVHSPIMLLACAIGSFIGTFIGTYKRTK